MWEPNLCESVNVRELSATFLKQNDRSLDAQAALEQLQLVYHVVLRVLRAIGAFVFGCHYNECKTRLIKHVREALNRGQPCCRFTVEFQAFQL
jgi:hypothetical protein